jgi:hypothetical protein
VDLHPSGFDHSYAFAVAEGNQVGIGETLATPSRNHALLWSGTADSVVDLHPVGFDHSGAKDVFGKSQVGGGSVGESGHALLWTGTATSVVDLHPAGFDGTEAHGIWGDRQVGVGIGPGTEGNLHALLWNGTAASVIDLHPAGFSRSIAQAVSGAGQVGFGSGPSTSDRFHALLWHDTAESVVDLHQYLDGFGLEFISSHAWDIAANGDIVGLATDANFNDYAVMWSLVPEPHAQVLIIMGFALLMNMCSRGRELHSAQAKKPDVKLTSVHVLAGQVSTVIDR